MQIADVWQKDGRNGCKHCNGKSCKHCNGEMIRRHVEDDNEERCDYRM